jgi:hypothetical protein
MHLGKRSGSMTGRRISPRLGPVRMLATANGAHGPGLPWLVELASALTDLDNGIVRPLLAVEKRKGLSSDEWRRRAFICIGMHELVKGGADRSEAAATARRASRTARQLSVRSLVALYDQFQKKRGVKNHEAAVTYAYGIKRGGSAQTYFECADLTSL